MKIPKEIVELAVQGGYKAKVEWVIKLPEYALYQIICDAEFWKALGKSLGWVDANYPNGEMRCENKQGRCEAIYCEYAGFKDPIEVAHRFFDLLMQQKPTDIFWEELLGNK